MSQLALNTEERKNKLVDRLSTQYSHNNISMEEYERIIKYSQNIETEKELLILEKLIEGHETTEVKKEEKIFPDSQPGSRSNYQIDSSPQNHFNLLSSRKTTGPLTGGNIMNVLGEHKIIITEDDLINDNTTINVMSLLGSVVFQVSENINVDIRVIPVLGDISAPDKIRNKYSRKSLVITGNVVLGDLKVKIKN
jgi:predicted membrane protein